MKNRSKSIFNSIVIAYIVLGIQITMDFLLTLGYGSGIFSANWLGEDRLIKGITLFVILATVTIIFLSAWTSQKVKEPLTQITNGIIKMTQGNYTVRMEFNAQKEFALIRDSFNLMVEKLSLAEAEKQKMQLDKTKMLMDLSHDIKTPIATIQYFSKALSEGLIEDEEKKIRYYNTIYAKGCRVSQLIDDLSEFITLDSRRYNLSTKQGDFAEFTRRLITEFYDEIEEKGIKLELNITDNEVMVEFDERLMTRAIYNIIYNAVKYNPKGTNLRIEVIETKEEAVFQVGDNGIGISEQVKEHVFEPFVRGDLTRKSDGGLGLGLAISKKIVESHGGRLELTGGKGGEKTEFKISLKKAV